MIETREIKQIFEQFILLLDNEKFLLYIEDVDMDDSLEAVAESLAGMILDFETKE